MYHRSATPSKRKIASNLAVFVTASVLMVAALVAQASISGADIDPAYHQNSVNDLTMGWVVSWEATGTNTWKFTYGDGQYVQYVDSGNGTEFPYHGYSWCGYPLQKSYAQALTGNGHQYATSQLDLSKSGPYC